MGQTHSTGHNVSYCKEGNYSPNYRAIDLKRQQTMASSECVLFKHENNPHNEPDIPKYCFRPIVNSVRTVYNIQSIKPVTNTHNEF